MARVYVRSITCSTMYQKAPFAVWKISSVACGLSSIKIDYSDCPESLISRINEVNIFTIKYPYSAILLKQKHKFQLSRLFCYNHTCYCVNMVSVTSASSYITPASWYHPCYQSRFSMYIRGLIPRNFEELAEAVSIGSSLSVRPWWISRNHTQPWSQILFTYKCLCYKICRQILGI